jgi:hypothetical protein
MKVRIMIQSHIQNCINLEFPERYFVIINDLFQVSIMLLCYVKSVARQRLATD